MQDWLTERRRATPERLALMSGTQQWTYAALDTAVSAAAAHLHAQGVRPGDLVAVLLPNSFAYVCLIHALARLGAVLVPLNTRLTPAELAWQIAHVRAPWLITDEELSIENCQLLIVNADWFTPAAPFAIHNSPFTRSTSSGQAIHNYQAVVFTSGTSGRPKGAMLTFANHFWSATASAYRLGVHTDDRWLSVLPLYHVGGLAVILRSCLYGTAVILHDRFDLDAVNHSLDAQGATLISLVPTMLQRLLQARDHWPAALRLILLGGAPAPPDLIQRANALPREPVFSNQRSVEGELAVHNSQFTHSASSGQAIHNSQFPLVAPTYGLTEAASQVATMPPAEAARKPGSVGKPLLFTRVKIVDEQGRELPPGQPGEIVVSGPTVMAGYFTPQSSIVNRQSSIVNRQSSIVNRQSSIPNRQSSIKTGDIGYLDADGDLWLVQRRSDLIVTGGENVYPAEVEAVLREHPAVEEVCVVGVPDPEWGQRVAAMAAVRGDVTAAELLRFARQRLAGYKIPRQMQLVNALPLTASGKIAREQVARLLAGEPAGGDAAV